MILITGGTGTLGKELARQLRRDVIIYSRNEYYQWLMRQEFPQFTYILGDVRDKNRLDEVMVGVDVIIHCAALKHVPIGEENVFEFVQTNILGSKNVVDIAKHWQVNALLISSDKAVEPINVYGATKLIAERLFLEAGYNVVRLGNFTESHGNVRELFRKQKESGVITITDPDATRYWVTVKDAAQFVVECLDKPCNGEVFIPEMEDQKISEIAEEIAPDASWHIIGLRKGEKLREKLE